MANKKPKKITFLFGAGASIPATCKSSHQISKCLTKKIEEDPIISSNFPWIIPLWELFSSFSTNFKKEEKIELPWGESRSNKIFEPNFEQLIYLLEFVDTYVNSGLESPLSFVNHSAFQRLLVSLGGSKNSNHEQTLLMISYFLTNIKPLLRDPSFQVHNPFVSVRGTIDYLCAKDAMVRLVADQFPNKYCLDHLDGLNNVCVSELIEPVFATTNYDLVLEEFFNLNSIRYQDGFSKNEDICVWEGIHESEKGVKLLKLHGSLDWFQMPEDWFHQSPHRVSVNDIYKFRSKNSISHLKPNLQEKANSDNMERFEFDIPHLIMGGLKDNKILDNPFIEMHRQWQNSLSDLDTLVIIGLSASDVHLLNQMNAFLLNNPRLNKIIIINPDKCAQETYSTVFSKISQFRDKPVLFKFNLEWDVKNLETLFRIPFVELLSFNANELKNHCDSVCQ